MKTLLFNIFRITFLLFVFNINLNAQGSFTIQLYALEGQTLSKANLMNYQINNHSSQNEQVIVKGQLLFKGTKHKINYQYNKTLKPGINQLESSTTSVQYTFSSTSLKKLFDEHGKLPNGELSYCITLEKLNGESIISGAEECIYSENADNFLINLMEPEDNAKISELYPMFSWMVNSNLISQLTYNIRVAEIKEGQNQVNAIMRNRPVYEQKGLRFLTQNYPVTAKQLEYFQPYAWTVDAYYKDILMGSAETWRFVIINDSLMAGVPKETYYLDVKKESGGNKIYAIGTLKLKYVLEEYNADQLTLSLFNNGDEIKLKDSKLISKRGDNRYEIDFTDFPKLKHLKNYNLKIENLRGEKYSILFQYINPDFVK